MQSISPEITFRGNNAWLEAISRFLKLTSIPILLGRSSHTEIMRNKISKDLKDQNLIVFSNKLNFDYCYEDLSKKSKYN